jgi:guanosine-3',5'-bis(diphosphate) 3'-pyrophosphohydrolase
MITRCTFCNKETSVPDGTPPGADIRCPTCRKLFKMPAPQPVGAAAGAAPRPAPGSAQGAPRPMPGSAGGTIPRPSGPSAQGTMPRPGAAPAAPAAPRPAPAAGPARPPAGTWTASYRPLLESVSLAARAHKNQMRKDEKTPYVAHVFRVALVVRHVFGIDDPHCLMIALLHDTLEDTTTDWDDLQQFGEDVGNCVATLTKDKRRPEPKREEIYCQALQKGPWPVQVCKLADVFDNLLDIAHLSPPQKSKAVARARAYLQAIGAELQEQARRPHEIVTQLLAEVEAGKT